jgi:hypothetical protein
MVVEELEPVLASLTQTETDTLFPILHRFIGFGEWIQEAFQRHSKMRELIQIARRTADYEKIIDITDELGAEITHYLERRKNILYPRIVQALSHSQLQELRLKLGKYWMFDSVDTVNQSTAA